MFILSQILNNDNDRYKGSNFRRTRITCKSKESRGTTSKTRSISKYHKGRIAEYRFAFRLGKSNESIRSKGKQFKSNCKSGITRLSLFFLYNPQILFTLVYIDTMFTDEMIAFNMIQLNSIFQNIQTFINIGVV